ncbi:MAG: hypothetical protein C0432_00170 [Candidatus Puniceispirillum sp.]|nr:hypothetical protein [Candidatus Pelagibacter sp.]MBA4282698.1 hypothetical protein [Candidatus Puniceispirillum sp.]
MKKLLVYFTILFCFALSLFYTYKQIDKNVQTFVENNFASYSSYSYVISYDQYPHLKINNACIKIDGPLGLQILADIEVYYLRDNQFLLSCHKPKYLVYTPLKKIIEPKILSRTLYIGVDLHDNYKIIYKRFDMQDFNLDNDIKIKNVIGQISTNILSLYSTPLIKDLKRVPFISLEIKHENQFQYNINVESSHIHEWMKYIDLTFILGLQKFENVKKSIMNQIQFQDFEYQKGSFVLNMEPSFW